MYSILKQLLEHFRIVAIDMLGYGASSRVHIKEELLSSPSATDNYNILFFTKNARSCNDETLEGEKCGTWQHLYQLLLHGLWGSPKSSVQEVVLDAYLGRATEEHSVKRTS